MKKNKASHFLNYFKKSFSSFLNDLKKSFSAPVFFCREGIKCSIFKLNPGALFYVPFYLSEYNIGDQIVFAEIKLSLLNIKVLKRADCFPSNCIIFFGISKIVWRLDCVSVLQ